MTFWRLGELTTGTSFRWIDYVISLKVFSKWQNHIGKQFLVF